MADGDAPNRIFLKKILYKIDFQLITEKMQEVLFEFVAEKYNAFFDNKMQDTERGIDIEINPNRLDQSKLNSRDQLVYVLTSQKSEENDGKILKIGKTFLYLELDLNLSTSKIPYYEWMAEIVSELSRNPIFRLSRIGLRKHNKFFILDENKDNLNDIFQIKYSSSVVDDKFQLDNFENIETYNHDPYTLKFTRNYSSGTLSNSSENIHDKWSHLIEFDFDLFTTNDNEILAFSKDAKCGLIKMNESIYDFFLKAMNPEVIDKINKGYLLKEYGVIPF